MLAKKNKLDMAKKILCLVLFLGLLPALFFYLVVDYGGECALSLNASGNFLCLNSPVDELIAKHIGPDIVYQIKFAYDYYMQGRFDEWVLNLWPPGLPFLHYMVLLVFGYDMYPMKIILLSSVLYGLMCFTIYIHIFKGKWLLAAVAFSVFPLIYISFRESLFLGLSAFGSDFFSFILLGCLIAFLLSGELNWRLLAVSAGCIAGLAYLRSYYYLLVMMYSVTIVLASAFLVLKCAKKGKIVELFAGLRSPFMQKTWFLLLVTWLFLAPWKIFLALKGAMYAWSSTDQVWAAQWRLDLPTFLSGLNTPCQVNKTLCEHLLPFQLGDTWATPVLGSEFYKNLTLSTFLRSPVDWYIEKSKFFYVFWFDGQQFGSITGAWGYFQYAISLGILVVLLLILALAVGRVIKYYYLDRTFFPDLVPEVAFLGFVFFNVVIFTFVHFESRYSVPIKWVALLFLMDLIKRRFFYKQLV